MEINEQRVQDKTSLATWIVFLITLVVVVISLVPVIFPALILRALGGFEDHLGVNPFETGIWTYPFLFINLILLGLGILSLKNLLPQPITKFVRFVFNFEVSAQVAFIVITILIGLYITFSVGELFNGKFDPDYYTIVKSWLENFNITNLHDPDPAHDIGHYLGIELEVISMQIFGNYKVIPFIASIALLVLTYYTTVEISKKRFAGIVSMVIVLQSGIFLMYDTSVAYPNFWILFYLLSLYLICKKWPLSSVSYVSAVLSKGLAAMFLPASLFFAYRTHVSKQKKIQIVISYGIIIALGIAFLTITGTSLNPVEKKEFNFHDFWAGFTAFYSSLRLDGLALLFLLPLTVGLFTASGKGHVHADSILFLILVMLLSAPLLSAFSDNQNVPYRFVPFIIFFALGSGIILSKRSVNGPNYFPR